MPMCQAYGCSNKRTKSSNLSFFSIPNPKKDRERCALWLRNIGTDKFNIRTYEYSQYRVVCEEHFEQDAFEDDVRGRVMGFDGKRLKRLKCHAVPTIFGHRRPPCPERATAKAHREQREEDERQKLLENLLGGETSEGQVEEIVIDHPYNDDSHDGDVSSDMTVTYASISDYSDVDVPSPYAYMDVETQPAEQKIQSLSQAGTSNQRKRKRRRQRSGQGNQVDREEDEAKTIRHASTQTIHTCTVATQETCSQTEDPEFFDVTTQSPEDDGEPPVRPDHVYASDTPDPSSLISIDLASILQEEIIREQMEVLSSNASVIVASSNELESFSSGESMGSQSECPKLEESWQSAPFIGQHCVTETRPSSSDTDFGDSRKSVTVPSNVSAGSSKFKGSLHRTNTISSEPHSTSASDTDLGGPSSMPAPSSAPTIFQGRRTAPPTVSSSPPSSPSSSSHLPSSDLSYIPSDETDYDIEEEAWVQYCQDPKYIVFGSHIDKLLYSLTCTKCYGGHIADLKRSIKGTLLTVSAYCVCGNLVTHWESQPRIGQASVGNLLCAASTLFSGQTHEPLEFFSSVLNLQFLKSSTFYELQDEYLFATINKAYLKNIAAMREEVRNESITVCGDGRCDSPGYSAKYCSYTLMNMHSNKILAMALVQVSEATSSVAMEKVGFERTMDALLESGINVSTVATDRHIGIRKLAREQYPTVEHQFDVWHISKSISKKLFAKSKKKECSDLGPWIKCVTNHLWWCATNCNQDADLLIEMWQSITHHVCNIHTWNSGEHFHECRHGPLPPDEVRKTKWLIPGSPSHKALQDVLFDRNLVKDIRRLTKACRTGDLEAFHNMLLKYCPKRKHFPYRGMLARLQLAVLDHNHNQARQQKKVKKGAKRGEGQVTFKFSKRSKSWVTGITKESKNFSYLFEILHDVLKMKGGEIDVPQAEIPDLPRNVAPIARPPREELLARQYSRF